MTVFRGCTDVSNFTVAGFKFERKVAFRNSYITMTIIFSHTGQIIHEAEFTGIDDYYCQLETIKAEINQFLINEMSEQDRLFAHLTSIEMNHELTD